MSYKPISYHNSGMVLCNGDVKYTAKSASQPSSYTLNCLPL